MFWRIIDEPNNVKLRLKRKLLFYIWLTEYVYIFHETMRRLPEMQNLVLSATNSH